MFVTFVLTIYRKILLNDFRLTLQVKTHKNALEYLYFSLIRFQTNNIAFFCLTFCCLIYLKTSIVRKICDGN